VLAKAWARGLPLAVEANVADSPARRRDGAHQVIERDVGVARQPASLGVLSDGSERRRVFDADALCGG